MGGHLGQNVGVLFVFKKVFGFARVPSATILARGNHSTATAHWRIGITNLNCILLSH
ncbi:hypothetical protein RB5742 [Rhodopirellula baltica SH 1]|uniref:Uncharacterized protein n=1 Tax=Rhodopirellula baltica (strain DSM 10527 / NCIMB 13988 / SH1) TaxID=243090 RepID=Q7URD1_RHOBA|nr:hypothetical protein RB5742 [Rhodopirellula baltica SH 1]